MTTQFPTDLDDFGPVPRNQQIAVKHHQRHQDVEDAMEAVQSYVGVTGSTNPSSLTYKINQFGINLAAPGGSALVGFLQAGLGAVGRTSQDKMRETVSVKDFGALGDGVTDDTLAIQRAIDHAETLTGGVGLDVYFPSGSYCYSALAITTSDVFLRGNFGTSKLLKIGTTGNGVTFGDQVGRIFNVGFKGLQFGQASANAISGAQVWFNNCGRVSVSESRTSPFPFRPATGFRFTNCIPLYLDTLNCSDNASTGILFQDCGDVVGTAITADANGGSGYEMQNVGGGYFANCTAFGNTGSAWFMTDGWPSPVVASRLSFLFFVNCIGDTSSNHNWNIINCVNSVWSGCWGSTQNPGAAADLHGFAIGGTSSDLTFQGCTAMHCNGSGLVVGNTAVDIRVIGGGFEENGQNAGSTNRAGVVHAGTGTVQSICAKDLQTPGFKTQQYGLIASPAGFMRIRDNHLEGNVVSGVFPLTNGYSDLLASGNSTGESDQAISATTCILPGLGEFYEVTGTTNIFDFQPKWKGRRIALRFASTAAMVGGSSLRLPGVTVAPLQFGTADLIHDGTAWLLLSFSINDNA
jgi:hypothetical protein